MKKYWINQSRIKSFKVFCWKHFWYQLNKNFRQQSAFFKKLKGKKERNKIVLAGIQKLHGTPPPSFSPRSYRMPSCDIHFLLKLRYLRKSCFLYLFLRIFDTTNNLLSESIESHRYQVCWKAIENNPTLLAKSRLWPWSCVLMSTSPSCQVRTKRCQKNSGISIWNFIFFSLFSENYQ